MKRFVTAALVVAALAVTGCVKELKHGTVVGKKHEAQTEGVYFVPIITGQSCSSTGSSTTCTPIYTQMPFFYTDPERWVLKMKDGKEKGNFYVDQKKYNATNVGDTIDAGGAVHSKAWPARIKGGKAK